MKTLVACLGNIFKGDDAFGVSVARELARRPPIPGAVVRDFGIRGLDFAHALLEPWDGLVIVDASPRGRPAGTLYLLELDPEELRRDGPAEIEAHSVDPLKALRWALAMGARLPPSRLIACEPAVVGADDELVDGLSPAVGQAVEPAARLVESACMSLA